MSRTLQITMRIRDHIGVRDTRHNVTPLGITPIKSNKLYIKDI